MNELENISKQGYGIARGEYRENVTSVAVPIRNYIGNVIAAINIVGPSYKFTQERIKYFLKLLLEEAAVISKRIGYLQF